jgi:Amidohydrolase family
MEHTFQNGARRNGEALTLDDGQDVRLVAEADSPEADAISTWVAPFLAIDENSGADRAETAADGPVRRPTRSVSLEDSAVTLESHSLVIDGATLIDGSGAPPVPDAVVLIQGDRIRYAGPRRELAAPPSARRITASGKTIVPGLIDLHNHSTFDADMRVYLKNGVTTIRFAGLNQDAVVRLRERASRAEVTAPRILSCGPMLDRTPPAYPKWTSPVDTPAEAAATARRLLTEERVEALLVTQQIPPELMRPIVDVAHEFGRPVVGQIWHTDGREAAELGIDQLDNSSRIFASREYPKARLLSYRSIAERLGLLARGWMAIDWELTAPIMEAMVAHGVSYCPTLVVHQNQAGVGLRELEADRDYRTMYGEAERREWAAFIDYVQGTWTAEDQRCMAGATEQRIEWMRRFHGMGGTLVVGVDMQFGGIMLHRELQNLAAAGLSPLEVIAAATGRSARELGMGDSLGTIEAGKLADLLVINCDPLDDLAALRDIDRVVKDGQILEL